VGSLQDLWFLVGHLREEQQHISQSLNDKLEEIKLDVSQQILEVKSMVNLKAEEHSLSNVDSIQAVLSISQQEQRCRFESIEKDVSKLTERVLSFLTGPLASVTEVLKSAEVERRDLRQAVEVLQVQASSASKESSIPSFTSHIVPSDNSACSESSTAGQMAALETKVQALEMVLKSETESIASSDASLKTPSRPTVVRSLNACKSLDSLCQPPAQSLLSSVGDSILGFWDFGNVSSYEITLVNGKIMFDQFLLHQGNSHRGELVKETEWWEANLLYSTGSVSGRVRARMCGRDTMLSNFLQHGDSTWSEDIVAHRRSDKSADREDALRSNIDEPARGMNRHRSSPVILRSQSDGTCAPQATHLGQGAANFSQPCRCKISWASTEQMVVKPDSRWMTVQPPLLANRQHTLQGTKAKTPAGSGGHALQDTIAKNSAGSSGDALQGTSAKKPVGNGGSVVKLWGNLYPSN
jgi:hypothetical protein